jgi:hypothetical protein
MKFDDNRVDTSQLQDRRGMGTGGRMGAGAGGMGIVALILFLLFGGNLGDSGFDPTSLGLEPASGDRGGVPTEDLAAKCAAEGALDAEDDCFVLKIFNETNEVWGGNVDGYTRPTLVFYNNAVRTACGSASSQAGPFYCPGDTNVYIDLSFLNQLQRQLGAEGRNAQAYVVAHEVGHHIQNLIGTERQVRALQQRDPSSANAYSVKMELQADCYAGVWARQANDRGNVVTTKQEFDEAIRAAGAVGDDHIMESAGMRVDPEKFTHGSAQQRQFWFGRGYESGDPNRCDTFNA